MAEGSRRFPAPWRADRTPHGYVVRDANGQELAYVYARETEVEAREAKMLTKDEARRIAINIARLPELLGKGGTPPYLNAGNRCIPFVSCQRDLPWPRQLTAAVVPAAGGYSENTF
jgi:hypothetical protein